MEQISRERLHAYLDDSLTDLETAPIEQALRTQPELRALLQQVREERDRGEHSLGGIWRTERLSCPTREELNGYRHNILAPELHSYIAFHLQTIACPYCLANLDDLIEKQSAASNRVVRQKRIIDSGAGFLER